MFRDGRVSRDVVMVMVMVDKACFNLCVIGINQILIRAIY